MYPFHLIEIGQRFLYRLVSVDLSVALFTYALIPIGAYLAFRQQREREDIGSGLGAFLRYCLPRNSGALIRHPTIRLDVGFTLAKGVVNAWLLVPLLFSSTVLANIVYGFLVTGFGARPQNTPSLALTIAMIAVCVVVQDFVQFFVHYIHHKIKLLWSVHKVHHSSEFLLIGFSVKRTHVLEEAMNLMLTSGFLGILIGVMSYGLELSIWKSEIYGVDGWFFLQLFSFWHLRHSHMSLSYGWLENILQSPAQHHLHHSFEREHWDKNFGLLFSFWDKIFGCFLRSVDPRTISLGLPVADRKDYDSVLKLYLTPFWKIFQAAVRPWGEQPAKEVGAFPERLTVVERPPSVTAAAVAASGHGDLAIRAPRVGTRRPWSREPDRAGTALTRKSHSLLRGQRRGLSPVINATAQASGKAT